MEIENQEKRKDPFPLAIAKQEIENARKKNIPLALCKITLYASDVLFLVKEAETLKRIKIDLEELQIRKARGVKTWI